MDKTWSSDRRLDILVLGPMGAPGELAASCGPLKDALEALLIESEAAEVLRRALVTETKVHVPTGFDDAEIVNGVFSHLDAADLVVVNVTPKTANVETSANVFYELALVHALGLPCMLVSQTNAKIPFYANTTRTYFVTAFEPELLKTALRSPLLSFLKAEADFTDSRITQFYEGLPIVDISASVGIATGYYFNFIERLLSERGFISDYPEDVKQVVVVRPSNLFDTFESEHLKLKDHLQRGGFVLSSNKLDARHPSQRGPIGFDQVQGIVVDLPRAIYPLKISPRLRALQRRYDHPNRPGTDNQARDARLSQTSERLLDRIERAIRFQIRYDREGFRAQALHFSTMEALPALLKSLGAVPTP